MRKCVYTNVYTMYIHACVRFIHALSQEYCSIHSPLSRTTCGGLQYLCRNWRGVSRSRHFIRYSNRSEEYIQSSLVNSSVVCTVCVLDVVCVSVCVCVSEREGKCVCVCVWCECVCVWCECGWVQSTLLKYHCHWQVIQCVLHLMLQMYYECNNY